MTKSYKTKGSLIGAFLRGSKRFFVAGALFSALTALTDLINPQIIRFTVDSVIGEKTPNLPAGVQTLLEQVGGLGVLKKSLWQIALVVILVALVGTVFRYVNRLANAGGAERLVKTMRDMLFTHIEKLPFAWLSKNDTGDLIQRCTSDVETVKRFLSEQLTSLFRIVVLIVLALFFMWGISPALTTAAAVFIPIIVLYSLLFHNGLQKTFRKADEEEGALSQVAQENLTGVRVVRAFGRERQEKDKFEKQNDIYTAAYMKLSVLLSAFWSVGDGISGLQVLTVVLYGAVLATRGQITAGDYIAFISYNAMISWPVRQLGRVISQMSKAGVSVDRIWYIMQGQEETDLPEAKPAPMDQDITFDHVSFRYGEDLPWVLKNVSFTVKAHTTLGILGSTGSGKSTAMLLLDRLYELPKENGTIRIGGVDIREIKKEWLRQNIGLVLQEPHLFSRTLADNIAITQPVTRMEEVEEAAQTACLTETVSGFAKGYETFVGERGVTLSGGQKQRTAIARMLLGRPPVMVFDDSLSAVDTETDAKIRKALLEGAGAEGLPLPSTRAAEGSPLPSTGAAAGSTLPETAKAAATPTMILISHRVTTLMECDKILVLHGGEVKEFGTHEELLKKNGIYRQIYDIQNSGRQESEGVNQPSPEQENVEKSTVSEAGGKEGSGHE